MIIIAKNQTAGALALNQIPVPDAEVPASGQVTLTDYATVSEIQGDVELLAHIAATDVIINDGTNDLTQEESADIVGPIVAAPPVYFDVYDSGSTSVGSSPTTLGLDTERQSNALFALASDEVTVQATGGGDYLVTYAVTFGEADSSNRVTQTWLELNSSEVPATRGEVIHWDEHGITGDGTCGRSAILTLAASDTLRVRGEVTTGSSGYNTANGGVGLTITSIGANGPPGPAGPTGSGSDVLLENGGTPVANTPHSTLNFVGLTVADAGGGTASITAATPSVFGEDMQAVASTARSTTTSSSFQTKVTLTTPTLTGAYRLFWTAVVDQSSTQDSVEVRLQDTTAASTVGAVQRMEPKDTDNRMFAGGLAGLTFTAESKSFSIQYRQQDGSTAGIQNAAIEIWRIS